MATSITGVNSSIQTMQVTVIQPKIAQADSQTTEKTAALNSSAQASGIQSTLGQPASQTTKTSNAQQNQQKADTVQISGTAKARMLSDKGNSISVIAVIMNLDTQTVEAYLGAVTVTTQAAQTALQTSQSKSQQPSSPEEAASGNNSEKQKVKIHAQSG
jgi:hypothetical protein